MQRAPTLADITTAAQAVQVKRDELDAWCQEDRFASVVQGTFVRVLMDEESERRKYQIGRVNRVLQAQQTYHFGNLKRTDKELELEFGQNQKGTFMMNTVSNSPISGAEFETWWRNMNTGAPQDITAFLQNLRATKLRLQEHRDRVQPPQGPPGHTRPQSDPAETVMRDHKAHGRPSQGGVNQDEQINELKAEIAKMRDMLNNFPAQTSFAQMTLSDLHSLEHKVEQYRVMVREAIDERRKCIVCCENMINILFMPCKHQCTCEGCALKLKECPMCRGAISDRIKPYGA